MSVPDFQSLMLPVLRAAAEGEIGSAELRRRVANDLGLSESDLAQMLPKGRQPIFVNNTSFALVHLQGAGLLEKVKSGVYRITEQGRNVLAQQPERVDTGFLRRYPAYGDWYRRITARPPTGARAVPGAAAELETDLLNHVRERSPTFFEKHILRLLIAMGYGGGRAEMAEITGRPGDGGIDGTIKEDVLGINVVYFQAKRYAEGNPVGRSDLQRFAGSLDEKRATKGIFVTTSTFSPAAQEYAQRISKHIVLIDGAELARLMVRYNVGVLPEGEPNKLQKVDEAYFTE
jgi:restriction system protein